MVDITNLETQLTAKIVALNGTQTIEDLLILKKACEGTSVSIEGIDTRIQDIVTALSGSSDSIDLAIASKASVESGSPVAVSYPMPSLPTPIGNVGFRSPTRNHVPYDGTLTDNIAFPSDNVGSFQGKLKGSVVWSLTVLEAYGSNAIWVGGGRAIWLDSVNGYLYVFVGSSGTFASVQMIRITVETGEMLMYGGKTLTTPVVGSTVEGRAVVSRPSETSGDFTLQMFTDTVVLSEVDGSEVSNVVSPASSYANATYLTDDGSVSLGDFNQYTDSTYHRAEMYIHRNGVGALVPFEYGGIGYASTGTMTVCPLRWGSNVVMLPSYLNYRFFAVFDGAEFDAWAHAAANAGSV